MKQVKRTLSFNFYTVGEVDDLTGRFDKQVPVQGPIRSERAQVVANTIAELLEFDETLTVHRLGPIIPIEELTMQPDDTNPIGDPEIGIVTVLPEQDVTSTYYYFKERMAA